MRSIWIAAFLSAILGVALVVALDGCGSSPGSADAGAVSCQVGDSCSAGQAACTRACRIMGNAGLITCECGTGALAGTLLCGVCTATGTGGASGTGGAGAGGRNGRNGTGGATGTGGAAAGGRNGRNGTGGATGTGGSTAISTCPADPPTGACNAGTAAICQTPCVNSTQLTCTCSGGSWLCPTTPAACI